MTNYPTVRRWKSTAILVLPAALAVGIAVWSCAGTNVQPPAPRATTTPTASSNPKSLVWIPVSELVGMVLMLALVIAVGVCLRVRQSRAAKQLADEPILDTPIEEEPILDRAVEEPEVPPIGFRCPDCHRGLKARAELAGKKVKCRQCGKPVRVPGDRAAANGHITK